MMSELVISSLHNLSFMKLKMLNVFIFGGRYMYHCITIYQCQQFLFIWEDTCTGADPALANWGRGGGGGVNIFIHIFPDREH